MAKGALIGKGMTAEVYEWGENQVLKLYYEGLPKEWVQYEAEIGRLIHQAGVPAPAVYEIVDEGARCGLLYERIAGASMLESILREPQQIAGYSEMLAKLHAIIHRYSAEKLPRQKDRLHDFIRQSASLLGERMAMIGKELDRLPEGNSVCHGDLHPGNVLLLADGEMMAIDWIDASSGNPLYDAARMSLMFMSPLLEMPPLSMTQPMKNQLCQVYLEEYCRQTGSSQADIDRWRLPAAAARLRERIPGEQEWLLAYIDEQLNGGY